MKIHLGKTKLPGYLRFISDGVNIKYLGSDEFVFRKYDKHQPIDRPINSMYGVSFFGVFIGIITTSKAQPPKGL